MQTPLLITLPKDYIHYKEQRIPHDNNPHPVDMV